MVPTDTLISMFDEPSSGSSATMIGAARAERQRRIHFLGRDRGDRRLFKRLDQDVVGAHVEFGLEIAAAVLVLTRRQIAAERAGGDDGGDVAASGASAATVDAVARRRSSVPAHASRC